VTTEDATTERPILPSAPPPPSAAAGWLARVDWTSWALLTALGVLWGGSFTAVGFAVRDIPPITVAAGRLWVAAIALLPLAFLIGGGLPSWRTPTGRRIWLHALGVGIATNALPFSLLSWAQTHVPSTLAGLMMAALPLVVLPLAAAFVPGERMTPGKVGGFLIGFAGVATLFGLDALGALGRGGDIALLAQLACLAAVSGYASGSVISKLCPPVHPVSFAAAALAIGALLILPVVLLAEDPFGAPWSAGAAAAVIGLGLLPTALAMILLLALLKRTGPSFLSLVNYEVPIWAMLFGILLLGETPPDRAGPALVLILGGVAISQGALPAIRRLLTRDQGGARAPGA
jgi:drug/metabolite transporter (DMT)-like permease